MNKLVFVFFIFLVFVRCNNTATTNKSTSNKDTVIKEPGTVVTNNNSIADSQKTEIKTLIIAGKSIGKIALGTDASLLQNILGKPDMSDAAMGKAWIIWYGKKPDEQNNKTELDIYTAYKDNSMRQQTVQQIRTTSSFFKTQDSMHVYSLPDDIKSKYTLHKAGLYKTGDSTITIYDDKAKGIAFEITAAGNKNICIGIIVHQKNKSVNDIYIMLHPDMKRYDK